MKSNFEKVKMAMLAVQRYHWEQGVCMQANIETAIAMAHDAVLRQQPDGRLAVIMKILPLRTLLQTDTLLKKLLI